MRYCIDFTGREVGAIGIFSHQCVEVDADSVKEAILKVYDTHEHLSNLFVNSSPYWPDGMPREIELNQEEE